MTGMRASTLQFKNHPSQVLKELATNFAVGYRSEIGEYMRLHRSTNTEESDKQIIAIVDTILVRDEIKLDPNAKSDLIEICVLNHAFFSPQKPKKQSLLFHAAVMGISYIFLAFYLVYLSSSFIVGFCAAGFCLVLTFIILFHISLRNDKTDVIAKRGQA